MLPEEEWPQWKGDFLDPILQINTSELPIVPLPLQNIKLLCIYVDLKNFLDDPTLKQSCQVRTYSDVAALTPKTLPKQEIIKSFEINWILNMEENRGLTEGTPVKFSDPNNQYRTKVGGWPGIIQHELEMEIENFVLQIGSEEKAKLNWVDGGVLYLGYKDEEWYFEASQMSSWSAKA